MPTKVTKQDNENSKKIAEADSSTLLNAMRSRASDVYQSNVPKATGTVESVRQIGGYILDYAPAYSEFMELLNRIAMTIVKNAFIENPLAIFDKGYLEYGETVQEIFVRLAEPHQYDELEDEEDWHMLQMEKPDIDVAYHYMNYQIYYKRSVVRKDVEMAFMSMDGVSDLIDKIVQTMYEAQKYDVYNMTMYMLGRNIIDGYVATEYKDSADKDSYMGFLRGLSNTISLPTSKYNYSKETISTPFDEQVVLVSAWFDGELDAESLAYAFHDDKANFKQRKIIINKWSELDYTRIAKLLSTKKGQARIKPFTDIELEYLDSVNTFICSMKYILIFTEFFEQNAFFNGEKSGWTYWLHDWKTISTSPYETAVAITGMQAKPTEPTELTE